MKLSEVPVKSFCQWDKMFIYRLSVTEYFFILAGHPIKKGPPPIDVAVVLISKEEFVAALKTVDHQNNWYSLLLLEMLKEELKGITTEANA